MRIIKQPAYERSYKKNIVKKHLTKEIERSLVYVVEISSTNGDIFKNGDIYKMHTYKDSILKSHGAYVLYPGK